MINSIALAELEPHFVRLKDGQEVYVDHLADAQGMEFLCPYCLHKSSGGIGVHSVLLWFRSRGVPDAQKPGPGRWDPVGPGFANLTLHPSIDLSKSGYCCEWHGWIRNGEALY